MGREEKSCIKATDNSTGKKAHSISPNCQSGVKGRANVTKTAEEKVRVTREC